MITRLKTRQATRGERLELKHKINRAVLRAIAMRMADAPRFESAAANEKWTPTTSEISRDMLDQAYGQQQQLEGTVRGYLNVNQMAYAEGINTATDSMLGDVYGQDEVPGMVDFPAASSAVWRVSRPLDF